MTGDIVVDTLNVHIGNVYIGSGADSGDIQDFIREQISIAGADPEALRDMGHHGVPEEWAQADEAPTPTPEQEEAIDQERAERYITEAEVAATARANFLRNVVHHVDTSRRLEGFQTNHERRPRRASAVDTKQAFEFKEAQESLERACAHCIFREICGLKDNLGRWIDVHPYKDDHSGERRPGSLPVAEVESRTKFLKAVAEDPQAHCDPAKRD